MSAQLALGAKYAPKFNSIQGVASLFPRTVEEVKSLTDVAKSTATASLTKILDDTQSAPSSFDDVCLATDAARSEFSLASTILSLVKSASTSKEIRDAATASLTELSAFAIDNFDTNRALFQKFQRLEENGGLASLDRTRDGDFLYWFDETIKNWKRQGLGLPDEKLEEAKSIKKKISDTGILFDRNIAEYKKELEFTLDQLKGVPDAVLSTLKKVEGSGDGNGDGEKRIVGLDYPTVFGIFKNCEVAETRKKVATAFENRAAPENLPVLRDLIKYRHDFAKLVAFESYAALDIDSKMSKTTENVRKFIDDLVPRLQQKWAEEKKALLASDLHPSVKLTDDGKIPAWDITFMMTQYAKKHLSVDETKLSEYFPVGPSVRAVFDIYEKFYGIECVRHTNLQGDQAFWHEDVEVLEIHESPRNKENSQESLLGYIVLDLHPREGKYSHAACWPLAPAFRLEGDKYTPPVAVVLCNFPKGAEGKPALLQFQDAVTFFHENGHAFHSILSRTRMATHNGTRVDRTFVEMPSQCLENWMWDETILTNYFKHHATGEPMDKDLLRAKLKAKNFFSGRDNLRQLTFATYSLEIFGKDFASQPKEQLDTTALFDGIRKRILPDLEYDQEGRFELSFGHLNGYGASYFGYMYSLVFSDDVFDFVNSRNGLLDPVQGKRYREHILGPGGSVDPLTLLERFLGRPPNGDAFLKHLGI